MTKNKIKKIVSILSIVCVSLSALIGLLLLFHIINTSDIIGKIYLSLLTIFLSGLFILNAVDVIERRKKLGIITSGLITLSAVLVLIEIWLSKIMGDYSSIYLKVVIWIAVLTILFDIFVSSYILLGKKLLILQILYYVSIGYILVSLALFITGITSYLVVDLWTIFAVFAILAFTFLIILKIKSKEFRSDVSSSTEGKIILTKEEYDKLLIKIANLEKELKEAKKN